VFFQAEDGIRDFHVTGVQTCALPISFSFSIRTAAWMVSRRLFRPMRMFRYLGSWSKVRSFRSTPTALPWTRMESISWARSSSFEIGRASCRGSAETAVDANVDHEQSE